MYATISRVSQNDNGVSPDAKLSARASRYLASTLASAFVGVSVVISSISAAATVDPPVIISGTSPNPRTSCVVRSEATPEMSMASHIVKMYAIMSSRQSNNTNDLWNGWKPSLKTIPLGAGLTGSSGDASSATGGVAHYASFIGSAPGGRCIAIAETTGSSLQTGTWDFPLSCFTPPDSSTDGPVIDAPPQGGSLWAVEREGSNIKLSIAPTCGFGQPGSSVCAVKSSVLMPGGNFPGGQATVSVNPCTGNGVVAYWSADNKVRLDIRRPDGTQVKNYVVASGLRHDDNTSCTNGQVRLCPTCQCLGGGCTATQPCGRSLVKPQVVVNDVGLGCVAYVTYDHSLTASDGKRYFKSRLHVIDLSTTSAEAAPVQLKTWSSTAGSNPWNQWQPTLSTSAGSTKVGWFWYSDVRGACRVVFEGAVDSSMAKTKLTALGAISQEFPNIRFSETAGLGDYVMGVRRSKDNFLYPSWSQSVSTSSTSSSCNSCGSTRYSKIINMSRVLP